MKVLVACEYSQTVASAFRLRGHDAYSCDILPGEGGHPEYHIRGDVSGILDGRCTFYTEDGQEHVLSDRWDLIIAHPPCTYLTWAGNRSFSLIHNSGEQVISRWDSRARAVVFFMRCYYADCDMVCVENPVGYINSCFRRPDQIVNPWQFALSVDDPDYVHKRTCLWLRGLPLLETNGLPAPEPVFVRTRGGDLRRECWTELINKKDRAKIRSKTFSAIAAAMAAQWGGTVDEIR